MALRLEDLIPDAQVTRLIGREAVRSVSVQMMVEGCPSRLTTMAAGQAQVGR